MDWNLGDVPTWLAGVGTVGTLVTALWQIGNERERRIAQEQKDREESRREQARRIASWPGPTPPTGSEASIDLVNGSDEPVYNVVVGFVFVQGAGAPRRLEDWKRIDAQPSALTPWTTAAILVPGRWRVRVPPADFAMGFRLSSEVGFTDRAGASWVRRGSGTLEELPRDPLAYFSEFGLFGPYEFQIPTSVDE
jgi:hypothetical protein